MPSTTPTAAPSGQPQPSRKAPSPAPARIASRPRRRRAARPSARIGGARRQRRRCRGSRASGTGSPSRRSVAEDALEVRAHLGPARRRARRPTPSALQAGCSSPRSSSPVAVGCAAATPVRLRRCGSRATDAEGRRPEARARSPPRGSPRASGAQAARELRVRLQPVADRALVAVVDLHDVDRDLVARGDERLEVAQHVVLADVVEEVVPAAPARDEGTRDARADARARTRRRSASSSALASSPSATRTRLELERARPARAPPRRPARPRCGRRRRRAARRATPKARPRSRTPTQQAGPRGDSPTTVTRCDSCQPARSAGGRAERVVETAQPGTGGKGGLARVVEIARAGLGPGLPAVAQEAQRAAARPRPAKAEHDGDSRTPGAGPDCSRSGRTTRRSRPRRPRPAARCPRGVRAGAQRRARARRPARRRDSRLPWPGSPAPRSGSPRRDPRRCGSRTARAVGMGARV